MTDDEFIEMMWNHPELWEAFKKYMEPYSSNISKKTDSDKI